jgi:hypothetical protein
MEKYSTKTATFFPRRENFFSHREKFFSHREKFFSRRETELSPVGNLSFPGWKIFFPAGEPGIPRWET